MSLEKQQQDQVIQVIRSLVADGTTEFRAGNIADALRAAGDPMGTWQIRATLTALEEAGLIRHDAAQNLWTLAGDASHAATG